VSKNVTLIIWTAVIAIVFLYTWRKGHLLRFRNYVLETREELKRCTWPTWGELKGSTIVVMITVLLLGAFTVAIDFVIAMVVRWMTLV
jgi:preprotein translocase subunit SecE